MSRFVDQCRSEWTRLGVPQSEANEMASDLEADLAEARADGVSPEEVLGNGYFDAKSFAASWARARGFVRTETRSRAARRVGTWLLAAGAVVGALIAGLGLLIVVGPRQSRAVAVAAAPFARRVSRPLPPVLVNPQSHVFVVGQTGTLNALGWLLLVAGTVVALGILCVWWWSIRRAAPPVGQQDIGLPSYL